VQLPTDVALEAQVDRADWKGDIARERLAIEWR
jgi:hypothetical protein